MFPLHVPPVLLPVSLCAVAMLVLWCCLSLTLLDTFLPSAHHLIQHIYPCLTHSHHQIIVSDPVHMPLKVLVIFENLFPCFITCALGSLHPACPLSNLPAVPARLQPATLSPQPGSHHLFTTSPPFSGSLQ